MTKIVLKCPSCGHMIDFGPSWVPIDISVPKTNGDVFREMTNEAIAKYLADGDDCMDGKNKRNCREYGSCYECWLDWLSSPIGDDEEND